MLSVPASTFKRRKAAAPSLSGLLSEPSAKGCCLSSGGIVTKTCWTSSSLYYFIFFSIDFVCPWFRGPLPSLMCLVCHL